jgi:hypothetical protein
MNTDGGLRNVGVGVAIAVLVAITCEVLGKVQYVRTIALSAAVFVTILSVTAGKFGRRTWFWLAMLFFAGAHASLAVLNLDRINQASAALTIGFGVVEVILGLILVAILADRLEDHV